ncbi:MAG: hypothetical protein ACE5H9_21430 [Anaerolineae bacterium]
MTTQAPPIESTDGKNGRSRPPELSAKPSDKRPLIIVGIVALVIVLAFLGLGYLLFTNPETTGKLRDIAIILLALLTLVVILVLLALAIVVTYLALKVNDLVQLLRRELQPLLAQANQAAERANDAVRTVHSRTVVISDEVVKPVINVVSYAAATKAIFQALFRRN